MFSHSITTFFIGPFFLVIIDAACVIVNSHFLFLLVTYASASNDFTCLSNELATDDHTWG